MPGLLDAADALLLVGEGTVLLDSGPLAGRLLGLSGALLGRSPRLDPLQRLVVDGALRCGEFVEIAELRLGSGAHRLGLLLERLQLSVAAIADLFLLALQPADDALMAL